MSASLHVPMSITSPTREGLSQEMLKIQSKEGGKVSIISITQDLVTKDWVCWYLPLKSLGGGLM